MNRHKLRSPAGASGTSRPLQGDGFLQHASFLRLWFTLIGTQAGLISIKGVLGLPYDQADWVAPGFILIAAGPVLYLSLKKKSKSTEGCLVCRIDFAAAGGMCGDGDPLHLCRMERLVSPLGGCGRNDAAGGPFVVFCYCRSPEQGCDGTAFT